MVKGLIIFRKYKSELEVCPALEILAAEKEYSDISLTFLDYTGTSINIMQEKKQNRKKARDNTSSLMLQEALEIMRKAISGYPYRNQADLARASGVSEANISRWLSGVVTPTLTTLAPVLRVLNVRLVANAYSAPRRRFLSGVVEPPAMFAGRHTWLEQLHKYDLIRKEGISRRAVMALPDAVLGSWFRSGLLEALLLYWQHEEVLRKSEPSDQEQPDE